MAAEEIGNVNNLQQVENDEITKEKEIFQQLYAVWDRFGIDEEQQVDRAKRVWRCVFDLLEKEVDKEIVNYGAIEERIKNYERKIVELSTELSLPAGHEITGPPIVREAALRQKLDELLKMKHKRQKEFQELNLLDLKYCKMLSISPLSTSPPTGIPTEKDIYDLQQHLSLLEEEKLRRRKKFYVLKRELSTILEMTELTPETPLEEEILTSRDETVPLSNETLKKLEEIITKRKTKKSDLENEREALMDKLRVLWDLLKVERDEKDAFLSKHADCRVSSLSAIKEEIARCEAAKRQHIAEYVDALREELSTLLEKCFISKSERKLDLMQDGEVDETLFEAYENEVAKWRKYYKDAEHIIQKINKREDLWKLMMAIENNANDRNRFKNRGGNLLQEERERNKIRKQLPVLDDEIFLDIEKYEEQTGKPFLYYGDSFKLFVNKQWDEKSAQNKNEKITRQKLRVQQLENERTPTNRLFMAATPKSAPCKFRTPVSVPIYRSPKSSIPKPVPSTSAKKMTMKRAKAQDSAKKVQFTKDVLDKNENAATGSDCPDAMTHTDLDKKVNSSPPKCRSSVLCSKKITGTRISRNEIDRKSVNKTIKMKYSSKLTPQKD